MVLISGLTDNYIRTTMRKNMVNQIIPVKLYKVESLFIKDKPVKI